jgi:hypothetical protein
MFKAALVDMLPERRRVLRHSLRFLCLKTDAREWQEGRASCDGRPRKGARESRVAGRNKLSDRKQMTRFASAITAAT